MAPAMTGTAARNVRPTIMTNAPRDNTRFTLVFRFRSSQVLAAPLMRTSESKEHWQLYGSSAVLDLKFLHDPAATPNRNLRSTALLRRKQPLRAEQQNEGHDEIDQHRGETGPRIVGGCLRHEG